MSENCFMKQFLATAAALPMCIFNHHLLQALCMVQRGNLCNCQTQDWFRPEEVIP
jgi:hypothetical protein